MVVWQGWPMKFELDPDFNYEPTSEESVAARAEKAGKSGEEYAYDLLCRYDGKGFIYLPILNCADGNLEFLIDLQQSDDLVNSLSDGGAHCGTICDAASPTFNRRYQGKLAELPRLCSREGHDPERAGPNPDVRWRGFGDCNRRRRERIRRR